MYRNPAAAVLLAALAVLAASPVAMITSPIRRSRSQPLASAPARWWVPPELRGVGGSMIGT